MGKEVSLYWYYVENNYIFFYVKWFWINNNVFKKLEVILYYYV